MRSTDPRQTIIRSITDAGFWACARDWSMGATVIAGSQLVPHPDGISAIQDYICLVPLPEGKWRLDIEGINGEVCESDQAAASRTIEVLRLPQSERQSVVRANWKNIDSAAIGPCQQTKPTARRLGVKT